MCVERQWLYTIHHKQLALPEGSTGSVKWTNRGRALLEKEAAWKKEGSLHRIYFKISVAVMTEYYFNV